MTQQANLFSAQSTRTGDAIYVFLAGELDLVGAPLLERELQRAAAQDVQTILIDLSALTFCDLAGQRALLRGLPAGARLIGTPPPCLLRLFELTGHEHLLTQASAMVPAEPPAMTATSSPR